MDAEAKGHQTHLEQLEKFANSPDKTTPACPREQAEGWLCLQSSARTRQSNSSSVHLFGKKNANLSCVKFVAQMFLCAVTFRSMQTSHMP